MNHARGQRDGARPQNGILCAEGARGLGLLAEVAGEDRVLAGPDQAQLDREQRPRGVLHRVVERAGVLHGEALGERAGRVGADRDVAARSAVAVDLQPARGDAESVVVRDAGIQRDLLAGRRREPERRRRVVGTDAEARRVAVHVRDLVALRAQREHVVGARHAVLHDRRAARATTRRRDPELHAVRAVADAHVAFAVRDVEVAAQHVEARGGRHAPEAEVTAVEQRQPTGDDTRGVHLELSHAAEARHHAVRVVRLHAQHRAGVEHGEAIRAGRRSDRDLAGGVVEIRATRGPLPARRASAHHLPVGGRARARVGVEPRGAVGLVDDEAVRGQHDRRALRRGHARHEQALVGRTEIEDRRRVGGRAGGVDADALGVGGGSENGDENEREVETAPQRARKAVHES